MKKIICLPVFGLLLFTSCKDKEVQCSAARYKTPCYLTFTGFAVSELDTMILRKYTVVTGFTQLERVDTLINVNVAISNGYCFATPAQDPFTVLTGSNNYELSLPAISKTYQLSNVQYSNDTLVMWTAKGNCGTYGTFTLPPASVLVDGQQQNTVRLAAAAGTSWLALSR